MRQTRLQAGRRDFKRPAQMASRRVDNIDPGGAGCLLSQIHPRTRRRAPEPMQIAANGIALEVEDHGPASAEPLVLVM
jgi:hypothetical protein